MRRISIFKRGVGYRKVLTLIVVFVMLLSMVSPFGLAPALAAGTTFYQGAGYQAGLYDLNAAQPTTFNWTRQSRFSGPTNPIQKWQSTFNFPIASSPAIGSDGTIYVGSNDDHYSPPYMITDANYVRLGHLYAINPNGAQKWAFPMGDAVVSSPAIGSDGTVYVGSYDHKLYAINPDGSQKWAFDTGSAISSSPAIGSDGTVYVGVGNDVSGYGHLYAINPNGTQKWAFPIGASDSSPAIGSDGTIYVGSGDGHLYAINPNGTQKWAFSTGCRIDFSPAIGSDGTIYVGSGHGLYALNPADGTQKWVYQPNTNASLASPAIGSDGTIYVGSDEGQSYAGWYGGVNFLGHLYAINPNGTQKWAYSTGAIHSAPIIGSDGTVYVDSRPNNSWDNGSLFAIDSTGNKKWMYPTNTNASDSSLAIGADGTLYVGGPCYAVLVGASYGILDAISTKVTETLSVSNPSTTGFTVALTPALNGLTSSNFVLKDSMNNTIPITSTTTLDSGATYAISAALTAGNTYTVTATKAGYAFGTAVGVVVPAPITNFTCTGKTDTTASFSFTAPIGATAVKIQQSTNGGITWTDSNTGALSAASTNATVTGLTQGTAYKFKLVVTGGIHAGDSNIVDVTTDVTEILTVSNPSRKGFTVALSPALNGLTSSNFVLKDSLNNSVTIKSATTSDGGATYTIGARLKVGKTYTVTAIKPDYIFNTAQFTVARKRH